MNWTCSTTKPFLKWRRTCHKSISSLTGVPARLLLAIFDWSIVTQINFGSKENKSRKIPSTYFPCPVPSGLPHRLHCVPMNIKRCGFKVFGGEIFPRVQHKFNTKATLCNLPYIRKNLETIRVMFVGIQVDTISCKGADSVCCPLSCVFSLFFIMREAGEIPRLRAAQCAAAPRPAPSRCPPCRCRGTRCGCSGGSCGSISPSARLPQSAG